VGWEKRDSPISEEKAFPVVLGSETPRNRRVLIRGTILGKNTVDRENFKRDPKKKGPND